MSAAVEMSPADVLEAAADYIDEHGWTQREGIAPDGRCCAIGALCAVDDNTGLGYDALWNEVGGSVGAWNDAPDQTAANVIATMRKVAADLRAEATA